MSYQSSNQAWHRRYNLILGGPAAAPSPPGSLTIYYDYGLPLFAPFPPGSTADWPAGVLAQYQAFIARFSVQAPETFETGFAYLQPIQGVTINSNGHSAVIAHNGGGFPTNIITFDFGTGGLYNTTPMQGIDITTGMWYATFGQQTGNPIPTFIMDITFNVPNSIVAFGIFLTDLADALHSTSIEVFRHGGGSIVQSPLQPSVPPGSASGAMTFWGFVDTTGAKYDSVRITIDGQGEINAIDGIWFADISQILP